MKLDMTWALQCNRSLCTDCDEMVIEAWERMTYGGLKVPTLPGYTTAHAVETPRFTITQYLDRGFWI